MKDSTSESHPNLPSGEWEGLYKYPELLSFQPPSKMSFVMDFHFGHILGFGSDVEGGYTWKGTYDLNAMICTMTKSYASHNIDYEGNIDENGIWGFWYWVGEKRVRGSFHIWPKNNEQSERVEEVASIKKYKLKNIQL